MARKRTTRHKGITRIDHPAKKTYGYLVRVTWKGETRMKFFSDIKLGDRLAALDAAIEWRNSVERAMGKPRTEQQVIGKTRSKSGIMGVRRRRENHTDYYEATWIISPGKRGSTRFSIAKHGEAKARALAKRARDMGEKMRWRTPRVREQPPLKAAPQRLPSEDRRWAELVAVAAAE